MGRRLSPEEAVSRVMADWLAEQHADPGPLLVVDDRWGAIEEHAALRGWAWDRWRTLCTRGVHAREWPPSGPWRGATLRLPAGAQRLELMAHAAAGQLAPGGRIWVHGANDEGARSLEKRLSRWFAEVDVVDARRHCRIVAAAGVRERRDRLEDWWEPCHADLEDGPLTWWSPPGTFAHGRLDPGSALLLASLAEAPAPPARSRVLDFACGVGVVSMVLARRWPGVVLHLLDSDALAIAAARRNVPEAERSAPSDGWSGWPPGTYHFVISNPPIHEGRATSLEVLEGLLNEGPSRLVPGGELRLVTQRTVPVARLAGRIAAWGPARRVADDGSYTVWSLTSRAGTLRRAPARAR